MMSPAGYGTVTIGRIDGFFLLNVIDSRGKSYLVRIADDLSECVFPGGIKLSSKEAFAQKSGGALGRRIDRVWSSDRFTVLVGVTLDDSICVTESPTILCLLPNSSRISPPVVISRRPPHHRTGGPASGGS